MQQTREDFDGGVFVMKFSLECSGNLVEYDYRSADGSRKSTGRYTWKDEDNVFYPVKIATHEEMLRNGAPTKQDDILDVVSFSRSVDDADSFDPQAIRDGLPADTTVLDQRNKRILP